MVRQTAKAVAGRYGFDFDECLSAGNIALAEAARTYDPRKNDRFDLFAQSRVMGEMIDSGFRAKRSPVIGVIVAARKFALRAADGIHDEGSPMEEDELLAQRFSDACDTLAACFAAGLGAAKEERTQIDEVFIDAEEADRDRAAIDRTKATLSREALAILERHVLGEEKLTTVARDLGVSERTARRHKGVALAAMKAALLEARSSG
jgi:RNA polymerase sigma factor (sigma-70 family)